MSALAGDEEVLAARLARPADHAELAAEARAAVRSWAHSLPEDACHRREPLWPERNGVRAPRRLDGPLPHATAGSLYGLDADGRVRLVRRAVGLGRLVDEELLRHAAGLVDAWTFELDGERPRLVLVRRERWGGGRMLASMTWPARSARPGLERFEYDGDRLVRIVEHRPAGLDDDEEEDGRAGATVFLPAYDARGRLLRIETADGRTVFRAPRRDLDTAMTRFAGSLEAWAVAALAAAGDAEPVWCVMLRNVGSHGDATSLVPLLARSSEAEREALREDPFALWDLSAGATTSSARPRMQRTRPSPPRRSRPRTRGTTRRPTRPC